jgi:hypothetical protein
MPAAPAACATSALTLRSGYRITASDQREHRTIPRCPEPTNLQTNTETPMARPNPYARQQNFTNWQSNNPGII